MTVFFHELKRGRKALFIWCGAISFMLIVCILMFPSMKSQMQEVNDMFANMGSFTSAFGMDKVSFGEMLGFYGVECGNVLGIGGGFFAAYLGIAALSKEEKEHTAEFLLTHPVTRITIIYQKFLSVLFQITAMNAVIVGISYLSIFIIGEEINNASFFLVHLAFYLLQIEIACICFGVSAFLKHSGIGIGIGLAAMFYFLNIIANITEDAQFLKYITTFGYSDASDIIANSAISVKYLLPGIALSVVFTALAFIKYNKKDIAA